MGSQEGPIESTEDAAIANQQPIAGKTKVDTLVNGHIKAADDESLVGASLDDAITSLVEKHDIQAGNNRILEIGTVVAKDPIMLDEVVRHADLGSNTSQREIQSFDDHDSNKDIVEEQVGDSTSIGMEQQVTHEVEQAEEDSVRASTAATDRAGSIIVENPSEQAPQKPSLLGEDTVDGLENSGVEKATGLNEENLPQEFSSREDRASNEDVNSPGELIMDKGDEPTSTTCIDQDEDSSEQVMEVQERPAVVEDDIQREPIAQELALPGQDEIVHEAQGLTTLDEKPDCVVEESTKHLQGVHEAPLAPESNMVKEEVTSASTEFPEQEVATHVEVGNTSNEVSDSLPTQGEILQEAPTTELVTDVEDVSRFGVEEESVALKGGDCDVDELTKYTNEEPAQVASKDNSSSLPMQDEVVEVVNVKDMSPTPVEEEPILGGEEEYAARKVEDCDVESTKDVQGADETPTSPVEPTDVVDESNVLETPPIVAKEEVIPASTQFELGEPELAKSIDVEVDSVGPLPLEEHADDVKTNSSQLSDSLPTEDEIVEEVPTGDDVTTAEDVPVDEEPTGGREEEFVALEADDSTKHIGVDEEPGEVHESKDVADESNVVKDELTAVELTEVNTENELVEVNTEDDVKSRKATPMKDLEPIVGGEEEYAASKVEDTCDVESPKDAQGAYETHTSPVEVEESTDVVETPPVVAHEEVIPTSTQFEGELAKSVDVEASTEDSVESTEAPVPLEEHADDVKNNSSQVSDSLPTQDEIVEEVPTGAIAEEVSSTPDIEGEAVEVHEPKDVPDGLNVVKDELTQVNAEDGLVEGNTEDDVKSREAPLPLEEPVKNDTNEVLGTSPMQDEIVEKDATVPLVDDVVVEAEPVAGGEKESLAPNDIDESTKHTGGVDEAEEPKEVVDESTMEAEVTPTLEDDVASREATVPAQVAENDGNEDSHSFPVHDETVEEAPTFTSVEEVSSPAQEETVGREDKSVKIEESAQGVQTPVEVEESTDVADGLDVVEEKAILASNQIEGEPDVEFREATLPLEEDPAQPTHDETAEEAPTTALLRSVEPTAVELGHTAGGEEESTAVSVVDSNVTKHTEGVDEAPPATTEIDESKDVVDESNVFEAPVVEEESKEVAHESNAGNETPVFGEESKEVVDESETPVVEEECKEVVHESEAPVHVVEEESKEVVDESETPVSKEVVDESETPVVEEESKDESNSTETPSTVTEEEVSPASTQFEGEREVTEVAQDDGESKGEAEAKEVPTLPLVTSVEDVTFTKEEPVCGGEEESVVASNSGDFEVDQSTKHGQGVVDALPAATELEESKDVVDELNVLETPSEEATPTSTESEGGPEEVAKSVEVTTPEPLALEEQPTQDSTGNEVLATQDEIVEEVPTTLITNPEDVEEKPVLGGEAESRALKVEDSDADETRKHTEGVEETLPTSNEVDESKDVVDGLSETASTVKLMDHVGGGDEQAADGDAQEVDQESKNVVDDDSNLVGHAPSTRAEDEVTPTSAKHEGKPLAPESGPGEVEVIKQDAVESREMPMDGSVENNSIEESCALSGPQGDDLELEGAGGSSEFEAEPQKATPNGVPQHEDVGDLSEEEREANEASLNGWSANGGLVASALRSIVTTTVNLVKTTKPSKKKRMKLKKVLEAKKMQQD